jgi:hypothetical protein
MKLAFLGVLLLLQSGVVSANEKYRNEKYKFKMTAMGEMNISGATNAGFHTRGWPYAHFGFTSLKASDGEGLTVYYGDFDSSEEATRFLDWKASNSFKVISRSTEKEPNGDLIEYRAQVLPEVDRTDLELIWVVGMSVHWIRGHTLKNALELERQWAAPARN